MLRAPTISGSAAVFFCMLVGLLALPAGVNARAPGVKTLTAVDFDTADEHVEFSLRADPPLDPAAISARTDGRVLMIRMDGTRTERRWLDTEDPLIKRTLLHPSRKHAPAAVVRTRLTRKVSKAMLANIRVRREGDAVIVAVPRSTQIARRWAQSPAVAAAPVDAAAPAGAVKLTFAPAAPAEAPAEHPAETPAETRDALAPPPAIAALPETTPSPMIAAPDVAVAAADEPLAAASADPADTPLGLDEDAPLGVNDVALSAGLASAAGPGVGAFLMSLLFLGAVGFLMWRKMRGNRATQSGRPIIRPVGSHMLGPKQSLLLVDVAGEMVLLGTTDKGVQMLTKIEGRDEPQTEAAPAAETAPAASFAERLGAAVSRFRSAAARLDTADAQAEERAAAERRRAAAERISTERYYAREDEALDETPEEDALAALAERVEDAPEIDTRRRARTRFAPVEPAPARKPAAPPLDPTADLLRKIRNLQRA